MSVDKSKTIFISGSAYEYGRFGDEGRLFIRHLTRALLKNGFKIVSGFGLGIGSYIVEEVLKESYRENKAALTDLLQVFPFPAARPGEELRRFYRDHMLSEAGIVIFIFGNKLEDIRIREADGVLEEFTIARKNNARLIPVGASGYMSRRIWNEVIGEYDSYFDTRDQYELYQQLGRQDLDPLALIDVIIQIALQHEKESIRQL